MNKACGYRKILWLMGNAVLIPKSSLTPALLDALQFSLSLSLSFFLYRILKRHTNTSDGIRKLEFGPHLIIMYEDHKISFQTFFVWAFLLIVYTWNSSPFRGNLLRLQCTCCTIPTTSGRLHGSPLVWACQWPSSQPLSSPQMSHNDCLWA